MSIEINPLSELDFKSQNEILEARTNTVKRYRELVGYDYKPSQKVFGQIVDGAPWWGINGIFFYGPGEHGPDGLSEESRFINNPFLLVGVLENRAWMTNLNPDNYEHYFPEPLSIKYYPVQAKVEVAYQVSNFLNHLSLHNYANHQNRLIALAAYNARDLGYHFIFLNPTESSGIKFPSSGAKAIPILQYLHKGGSCGFPGGCNNMSPYQAELEFEILSVPCNLSVKLWRADPSSVSDKADLDYLIKMN